MTTRPTDRTETATAAASGANATERFFHDKQAGAATHSAGARRPARHARSSPPCTTSSASTRSPTTSTTRSRRG